MSIITTTTLIFLAACAAPGRYSAEFVEPPRFVVEGRPLEVRLRYAAAEAITLRLELKSLAHIVLQQANQVVRGAGEVTLRVDIPSAAQHRELILGAWMGDDWQASPCGVVYLPPVAVLSSEEAAVRESERQRAGALRDRHAAARGPGGLVGLYQSGDGPLAGRLETLLRERDLGVARLDAEAISNEFVLQPELFDLLVVIDPTTMPGPSAQAIGRFSEAGGKLMVLGCRAFDELLWPSVGGDWLTREELLAELTEGVEAKVRFDFEAADIGVWERGTNDAGSPGGVTRVAGGADGTAGCAEIRIGNLTGWDTYTAPGGSPFGTGETWLCFWARGARQTRQLAIELRERDGSRWIGTVDLTADWRRYVLPPSQFPFWHDSGSRGRGGAGDMVRPAEVEQVIFGLAHTHTQGLTGEQVIWIDEVGGAPEPPNGAMILEVARREKAAPRIEAVSPGYKLYPVTNLAGLRVEPAQAILPAAELPAPQSTWAPHRRPNGSGFRKSRRWRQQPLLETLDAEGKVTGAPVTLTVIGDGGVTVSATVDDPRWLAGRAATWAALAARTIDGLFLYEGGSEYYATAGDEAMPVGATVTNRGRTAREAIVRAEVTDTAGRWVWGSEWPVTVASGESATVESEWPIPAGVTEPYRMTVTLEAGGAVVDRLSHEVLCWQPSPAPEYLTIADGEFRLRGERWVAHGVNYMPSSGIGIEDGGYFEHWIGRQAYDPEIIERDLTDCEAIGFNMVSVFQYHQSMTSRNLLDLLIRCRNHGLHVNLSLRPGTPLEFPWDQVREMIEYGRLAEHDIIFAYDLAWEPQWGNHERRLPYDGLWAEWVDRRHGGLAAAEQAWGMTAPREAGRLTNPLDGQAADPACDRMLVDYRRFLNELLHERYGRARELVKSIDPHHAVSFRMSEAGNPTVPPSWFAYDFVGLAEAVDLYEPEGYGRIGEWDKVRPGWFTTAYARAVNPALPVMWAEFGYTSWDMTTMSQDAERLAWIAGYYDRFYDMVARSGADGTVCWWFPGGFRVGENSDYGILNPDRSWRDITRVIHRWSGPLRAARPRPEPDLVLPVRRDHPQGISGNYDDVQERFWSAVEAGRVPGLRFAE